MVTDDRGGFKTRYNHIQLFRDENKKSAIPLSQYIWDVGLKTSSEIKWEILRSCPAYTPGTRACNLCVSENLKVNKSDRLLLVVRLGIVTLFVVCMELFTFYYSTSGHL